MNYYKSIFIMLGISFLFLFEGCLSHKQVPNSIYSDNYSTLSTSEQRALSPHEKSLSKQDAINIALAGNPGYKRAKFEADAAQTEYYKALGALSPVVAVATNTPGVSANYQAFNGGSTVMNILSAKAKAEQSEWDVKDHRRKLIQDIIVQDNQLYKNSANLNIQAANEKFQSEMAKETIQKYNKGKASKADILNFKIQALEAINAALTAERDYRINSYKLAASMGTTTAKLPGTAEIEEQSLSDTTDIDKKELVPGVNFYLDTAITRRPDLKAQREALKAAGYELYSAWGKLLPTIGVGLGSRIGFQTQLSWYLLKGGSRIAAIRSKEALYGIQQEVLLKKWIDVVQNVKTKHENLTANTTRKKLIDQAVKIAIQRRNLVLKKYNTGKADIAELNQAQNDLVNARLSSKQADVNVSNAKASLNAACGIQQY